MLLYAVAAAGYISSHVDILPAMDTSAVLCSYCIYSLPAMVNRFIKMIDTSTLVKSYTVKLLSSVLAGSGQDTHFSSYFGSLGSEVEIEDLP